jgi:xylose dehydrogenase (NAD/NADP)
MSDFSADPTEDERDDGAMEPVRWGIIGPGGIARGAIMPAFAGLTGAQVIAVASGNRARAQQFARDFGIPRVYGGYDLLVDDPDIEAVYISLPNHLHSAWTIRALQAGKHVLCEKPLAATVADAEAMAAAAEDTGLHLMEAVMYRFHPRMREVWSLVRSGAAGEPQLVRASFCFTMGDPENYRNRPEMGGGALLDVGIYCVSVARWLLDEEPEAAIALGTLLESGADESVSGVLEFPSGALAQVQCSFGTAEHQMLDIVGDAGTITAAMPFTAWVNSEASIVLSRNSHVEETIFPPADPYALMIAHFDDCVRGDDAPWFPAADGVGTMRALDALRRSTLSGHAEPV